MHPTTEAQLCGAPARVPTRRAKLALLLSMNAIYFFAFFHRVAVPGTLFDELQTEFRASAGAIALLGAIYLYVYAGMQCFAGMMSDRLGAIRVLVAGGSILGLGAIAYSSLFLFCFAAALAALVASLFIRESHGKMVLPRE